MKNKTNYKSIINHYENCYEKHGDSPKGVDWPNEIDANRRYEVMLDVIPYSKKVFENPTFLDFGSGLGHILEYIRNNHIDINYSGLDLSLKMVEASQRKYPEVDFICKDVLEGDIIQKFDFIVMNGVFTEKRELSNDDMWQYFKKLTKLVFSKANYGIAFNVMSKNVDWERDDLYHLSKDKLTNFLTEELSRNFLIRNDYGLYEYTTYVYK